MLITNCQKENVRKKVPFTIASERISCQGINLTMEAKSPQSKNCILMKEIKEDTNQWKVFHAQVLKDLILLNLLY